MNESQVTPVRVVLVDDPHTSGQLVLLWLLASSAVIAGRAGLVDVRRGRGHVVLFGFRPQYRGQSLATYPLLFNAIRSATH